MIIKKIKSAIENILNVLPAGMVEMIGLMFNFIRGLLVPVYIKAKIFKRSIRFCDFIISRTNGNRFIEFELSNICNARCVFCPYPDMLRSGKKFMHMDLKTLEQNKTLLSHFNRTIVSFTPTTGDTLMHPEWDIYMERILEDSHVNRATIFTNAINLDEDNRSKFLQLLKSGSGYKLNQIYFSVGGPDAESYKELYKVDKFKIVIENIYELLVLMETEHVFPGINIHFKLPHGKRINMEESLKIFQNTKYPFLYFSSSSLYYKNDAYQRNAILDYRKEVPKNNEKACAYLLKTRFAADGGIWADGCVISELPGDSSLKLGDNSDTWEKIESERANLINKWEKENEIPLPCQGCTMYRSR